MERAVCTPQKMSSEIKTAMRFPEVKQIDHPTLEEQILDWWEQHGIFEKSVSERAGAPHFTFYEGPPTANGRPGVHHVMSRAIKDIFCRYRTMKGYRVERKAGWDTHGLPVEIEVEKDLGLEGRHQVEEYGIDRYNRACRESVLRYKDLWDKLTVRMGYWVDLDDPYITFKNEYIESVWWLLKQMYDRGFLYQGHKIQWYSPGSGTVLSSHEVSLGYTEVQDPSVYVRFPVAGEENTFFLAWTTTPWTLISNTALAVGPDIDYVKIRQSGENGDEFIVLAGQRLAVIKDDYEIVETLTGADMIGKRYEPVFPYFKSDVQPGEAWRVVEADFVSTEDGTGIVHMAPAFGADDFNVGKAEGLPVFNPIRPDGRFEDRIELVAGMWFKDADKKIVRDLRDRGLLYHQETYLHNYPHDWRKGTPLMSYPVESWFIRTTAVKDRLIEVNSRINWYPPAIGTGRFGQWLENNVDWAISRNRYWGTPLPIWQSDKPGSDYTEVIGSIAELREKAGGQVPPDDELDLHRPFVDSFTWPAPDGGTMRRVPDLIDVWFDSGAMPFAQWHYPFENRDRFEQNFPADFIAEGVDQTRGWFYTLHAIAVLVKDSPAYFNVISNGLLVDENGEKMSKSKGNAVEPFQTLAEHGADPVRWYMMSNSPPWENLKWSDRGLRDTRRKFFSTLINTYAFFATYANIDGFRYDQERITVPERAELDRWVMSRLNTTVRLVDEAYGDYNPTRAARQVENFVEELSNWYVRRSRRRFWKSEVGRDKAAAYQTIYECLMAISKMMSPIAPFYSEWMYRALNETTGREEAESVHLALYPEVETEAVDESLEYRMDLARTIASIVLGLRNEVSINVRQPLSRILVVTGIGIEVDAIERVRGVILDEVNVKDIEYLRSSSGLVNKTARPNFKVLGKRLGPLMKPLAKAVQQLTTGQIEQYEREKSLRLGLETGDTVDLQEGDLEVSSAGIEGWQVGQERGITVALDTNLTDDLVSEGMAREFVNRVQNLRKSAGYDVTDRIRIRTIGSERIQNAVRAYSDWIRNETLATELEEAIDSPDGDHVQEFEIGTELVTVAIRRLPDN